MYIKEAVRTIAFNGGCHPQQAKDNGTTRALKKDKEAAKRNRKEQGQITHPGFHDSSIFFIQLNIYRVEGSEVIQQIS